MPDIEENDGFDIEAPKRRGRPPKRGRGRPRKVTKVTRQEFIADDDADDDAEERDSGSPLFDEGDIEEGEIRKIRVSREEPKEGTLGYLEDPGSASEQEILDRWGGGVFRLFGVDAMGKIKKIKAVRIAGDPIFLSSMAKLQWEQTRRRLGHTESAPGGSPSQGMSVTDLLTLFREQAATQQTAEREMRAEQAKLDRETADRRRREDEERDERRKRDEEDRERRRRQEAEEAEARRRIALEESDKRSQSFLRETIAMIQAANNQTLEFVKTTALAKPASEGNSVVETLKLIAMVKDVFPGGDGGGEENMDPLAIVARHGGEWLQGLGAAVGGAIREVKHKPGESLAPLPGQPVQQIAAPALALPATLAPKVASLVNKIAATGQNPEEVMGGILDHLNRQMEEGARQAPHQTPAPVGDVVPRTPKVSTAPAPKPATVIPQPVNREVDGNGVVRMGFGR